MYFSIRSIKHKELKKGNTIFFITTKTIIFIDTNKTHNKFKGLRSYNKSKFITDQCKDIQIQN